MKLRIKGNSIRLRLGQSEVRRLAIDGAVEEFTMFGPSDKQLFGYALCASLGESRVTATFADRRMTVRIPVRMIHEWMTTDQVSIHATQGTGDEGELRILIEKDFECIDGPPEESQDDAFPNPLRDSACEPAGAIERPT